ncbi:hypothetical protein [Ureibacillus aquaedulcis]|uniref:Uncharacterized protein n=1 Tax=Ureibacillus aquaedulcis TaxID=3058421 RepID=A0ABT8GNN6_9BACL|nr:hypothetical protein [Ureibacillus sp. BA0131]MDN4492839.1 hypothetical protein [Ureibacillus sp. BA0131]
MNYFDFINPENWMGGYYELSMEFQPLGDDKRLNDALLSLTNCNFFKGLWQTREDFQTSKLPLPIKIEPDSINQLYGTLSLRDGNTLPCLVSLIRINEESDWLDISIPQASFNSKYAYTYPLTKELNPWLEKAEKMYITLAEIIYKNSPFDLAVIGEEVSGYTSQNSISIDYLGKATCILPMNLQRKLDVQGEGKGKSLSSGLLLFYEVYGDI